MLLTGRGMKLWYLLYCKRNQQDRVEAHLSNQGVECYFPKVKVRKVRNGKRKELIEPLFPSYIFIKFDYKSGPSFTTVRSTRGVVDFIRQGRVPVVVPETLIDSLKDSNEMGHIDEKVPQSGDIIKIKGGPFVGVEAVFYEEDGDTRSVMLVNLINNQTKIVIENIDLDLT